jgi:hypothetical protein
MAENDMNFYAIALDELLLTLQSFKNERTSGPDDTEIILVERPCYTISYNS